MDFRDMIMCVDAAFKRTPWEGTWIDENGAESACDVCAAYNWWYNHMLPELIRINETYIDCRGCIHCSIVGDKDGYICEKNKRTAFYNITSVQGCTDYVSWCSKEF